MEQGFIMDVTHGGRLVSHWAAGPPQRSFWLGTKASAGSLIPVGTFRCSLCGYLESYAQEEFAAH
jgi:hypothetical protein